MPSAASPVVLLVDDRPENLLALRSMLGELAEELGVAIVEARSADQALRHVLAHGDSIAVALLDVQMPGTDGIETARLIRSRARTGHLPIIFVTALDADPRSVAAGYEAGAVDYLFKPLAQHVVRAKVRTFVELFRHREAARQAAAASAREHAAREASEAALREETALVSTIQRIGTALASELDLDRIVQGVTDEATALTRAQFGAFFYNVVDPDRGEAYTLYTLSGVPREHFAKFPHPRATPVFGPTFRGEGVVRSADITAEPTYGQMAPYHGMPPGHLPVRSYLAVPVRSRSGSVLGGLFFGHAERGVFTERDERLVVGIAGWAAVAMDNGRLYAAERGARGAAEAARAALQAQTRELELANERLQDNAAELEAQAQELRATAAELEERTHEAEHARAAAEESERLLRVASAAREAELRTVADAIPTLAWTARADGEVDWFNARWYEYTGMTPEGMATEGWQAVHHPDELPWVVEMWRGSVARGEPNEMTFPLRAADGTFRRFLTRFAPLKDHEGRVVRWFGTSTDVEAEWVARETAERERASAEAARRRVAFLSEASALLASSLDYETTIARMVSLAVPTLADWAAYNVVADDGTIRTVAIHHAKPEMERLVAHIMARYPIRADEEAGVALVLRTGEPGFTPEIPDAVLESVAQDAEHLRLLRSIGFRSLVNVPLVARGEILGAFSFATGDSGRVLGAEDFELALELARRAAVAVDHTRLFADAEQARADAERANQAKTDFLATMSHELRTPLNAIAGYAELLELGIHGPVTEEQREAISRIQRSQRHLLGLINDVLNFAKLEAGHVEFDLGDVRVRDVLDALEPLVAPQLSAKSLRFGRAECDDALVVRADADKVRQILVNLLSNAIKFTAPGGEVSLRCEQHAHVVSIAVRDTGMGIAADRLEQVFAPFVQVDRRLNAPHEGTGLGLAISRDLARGMGGDLRAESVLGAGSTFTLTLPRA